MAAASSPGVVPSPTDTETAELLTEVTRGDTQADPAPPPGDSQDDPTSAQWNQKLRTSWTLRAAKLSGGTDPLTLEFGGERDPKGDKRLVYTYFNLDRYWSTEKFLSSMDGPPGPKKCPPRLGRLGKITTAVWFLSLPLLAFGLWRWGDCRRGAQLYGADENDCWLGNAAKSKRFYDTMAVVASVMTLPGYIGEILMFELSLLRIIWRQASTLIILFQILVGCILLTLLVWDARVFIVWISIFVGVVELTFSDAITADAVTTKRKQKINVFVGAMPFVIALNIGLYLNNQGLDEAGSEPPAWYSYKILRLPLSYDDCNDGNTTDAGTEAYWLAWHKRHDLQLTASASQFQAILLHLALFVYNTAANWWYGTNRSVMLKAGLELKRTEQVNIYKLWQSVLNASEEEKQRLKADLLELTHRATAAEKAHKGFMRINATAKKGEVAS